MDLKKKCVDVVIRFLEKFNNNVQKDEDDNVILVICTY